MVELVAAAQKMTFSEWAALPDHGKQRPVELHAPKAIRRMLNKPSAEQIRVDAAYDEAGVLHKVNGHTRTYVWQKGLLPKPPYLLVDVYRCETAGDFDDFYHHFDNSDAAESATDRLSGALNQIGIDSTFLRNHGGYTAITLLQRGMSSAKDPNGIYSDVNEWATEIRTFLDRVAPSSRRWKAGVITGYLLALRKAMNDPDALDRVLMFGVLFDKDRGTKFNGIKDAVQTLAEWVDQSNGFNGHQFLVDSAGMTLRCIDNYMKRKNMTRTPPTLSFYDVRREVLGLAVEADTEGAA
jgi:hypothetical protein